MTEALTRHTSRPEAEIVVPESVHEYLAFSIDDEIFAVPLSAVREILKVPPVCPVPRASRDVLGIISVRGRIISVLDLRRLLNSRPRDPDKHTRVLLVDSGDEVMGLFVDRVHQVFRLRDEEIELASAVAGDLAEHVHGIGRPRSHGRERKADALIPEEVLLILLDPVLLLKR